MGVKARESNTVEYGKMHQSRMHKIGNASKFVWPKLGPPCNGSPVHNEKCMPL